MNGFTRVTDQDLIETIASHYVFNTANIGSMLVAMKGHDFMPREILVATPDMVDDAVASPEDDAAGRYYWPVRGGYASLMTAGTFSLPEANARLRADYAHYALERNFAAPETVRQGFRPLIAEVMRIGAGDEWNKSIVVLADGRKFHKYLSGGTSGLEQDAPAAKLADAAWQTVCRLFSETGIEPESMIVHGDGGVFVFPKRSDPQFMEQPVGFMVEPVPAPTPSMTPSI